MILATGNATVGVTDANAAIGIAATGDVHAESLDALRIAGASGASVTLIAGTDLTLSGNLVAGRDLTATATAGDVLGASARLGAGLTADGTLTVNGANIALLEASSRYDLKLNGTGIVDVGYGLCRAQLHAEGRQLPRRRAHAGGRPDGRLAPDQPGRP